MSQSDQLDEEPELDAAELQRRMVALSQKIADACDGQAMMIVHGALGHLQVQLIMRAAGNDLDAVNSAVDALARAMKDDAQQILEHAQREVH